MPPSSPPPHRISVLFTILLLAVDAAAHHAISFLTTISPPSLPSSSLPSPAIFSLLIFFLPSPSPMAASASSPPMMEPPPETSPTSPMPISAPLSPAQVATEEANRSLARPRLVCCPPLPSKLAIHRHLCPRSAHDLIHLLLSRHAHRLPYCRPTSIIIFPFPTTAFGPRHRHAEGLLHLHRPSFLSPWASPPCCQPPITGHLHHLLHPSSAQETAMSTFQATVRHLAISSIYSTRHRLVLPSPSSLSMPHNHHLLPLVALKISATIASLLPLSPSISPPKPLAILSVPMINHCHLMLPSPLFSPSKH